MNDTILLLTGLGVFSLMLIGVLFTVVEFRRISRRDKRRNASDEPSSAD
jgi:hypothetical protein